MTIMAPYYIIMVYILSRGIYSYKTVDNIRSNVSYIDGVTNYGFCGDNLCFCVLSIAECFGYRNPLRYIPKLPNYITEINFKDNYLPVLNSTTMTNVSHLNLTTLSLTNNKVISISSDAFKGLRSLRALTFGKDPGVNVNEVANTLSNLKYNLHRVAFIEMRSWYYPPRNMFENIPEIREIRISFTMISRIEVKTFSVLSYLNRLDLSSNLLRKFDVNKTNLHNLKVLSLKTNLLSYVPVFCNVIHRKSVVPELIDLNLEYNSISKLTHNDFKCLPRLSRLTLGGNPVILVGNNFISSLSSLRILDLSGTGQGSITKNLTTERYALNSSSLQILQVMKTNLQRFMPGDPKWLFSSSPSLYELYLSESQMPREGKHLVSMFSPLTHLQKLDLSNSGIQFLPHAVFSEMASLKELSLRSNDIRSLNGLRLFGNYKFFLFDLSYNKISVINETSFPSSILQYMENNSLDLRNNPYLCTCETVNSINWFRRNRHILKKYPSYYKCVLPPEVSCLMLQDYNPSPESCTEKNITLLVSVPVFIISIAIMSTIALLYQLRWHLRYRIYLFNNRYKSYEQIKARDGIVYAGFVIYSDDDRHWVHNEFIHRIEDQEGFRLCIRLRDFEVGKVHVDNIVENMLMSEKIIVVLSNNFAKDEWCQFQLLLAETRLLKQNMSMLVLLMLEEIQSDCLRASLYHLVTERQYALWSEDGTGNELFWEQTLSQLRRPTVIN